MDKSDKIIIKKSHNADTRTAEGEVTKEDLLVNSRNHIEDVRAVGKFMTDMLAKNIAAHDYTKVDDIDLFYSDFVRARKGEEFTELDWYQKHITKERHHIQAKCHADVNLLDILEMVIDCTVAGMARSGEVFPMELSSEVINLAMENTKQLILDKIEVSDESVELEDESRVDV